MGDYGQAIEYHAQDLAIAKEIGHCQGEASALGSLGIAYEAMEDLPRAIKYHTQALAIMHSIGDRQGKSASHAKDNFTLQQVHCISNPRGKSGV